ncbi:ATP-binding protein [Amycolatopsis sp., V23-08]|uniref:histidine kinase n=1 Tax=Amycolatopsis heterodermiae TaxID=3110235 RepID=A0ABU5RBH4_9PSEU|nr:ATP-binding protein [Amycolatopsis sp., V23-08]MEA5362965.1 ATP-binding protein [Amycolatopsis sp., V23-08]
MSGDHPRWHTLRVRLTLVAGLVITGAVVLGIVLLYLLQVQSVDRTLDGQLRAYAVEITESAANGAWPRLLAPSTLDADAQAQVLAPDGHVLAATRTLAGLPAMYSTGSGTPRRTAAADGVVPDDVRVVAVRQVVGGQPVTVLAGTPTGLLTQLRDAFTSNLLLGFPVILLVAAVTVWLIVGRVLRPVERIRHAVTEITSADLSRRVPEPGTPDEIGSLARTMNDMLGRLENSAGRQRRFVADASHELRSPLAALRTTLEVGLAHRERAPWPEIAERATRQSQRLEDLIQQLLLLARADEHQLTAQASEVDIGRLLHDIRASTPADGVTIDVQSTGNAVVLGHAGHLERLFRNVLDNAVRHAETSVHIRTTTGRGRVVVEIADDGPGIPVEDRDRVFDRFVRLDGSRDRASGTSGLGLAIAREIVTAHRGGIVITDTGGHGTTVFAWLPHRGP